MLGNYVAAIVHQDGDASIEAHRYIHPGAEIPDRVHDWIDAWTQLAPSDQQRLQRSLPKPAPFKLDIIDQYLRLQKFNFADLAMLAAFKKLGGATEALFTTSDVSSVLRINDVPTTNLSSALRGQSEGKSDDDKKLRQVSPGTWQFTGKGIQHVRDLLRHAEFRPNTNPQPAI